LAGIATKTTVLGLDMTMPVLEHDGQHPHGGCRRGVPRGDDNPTAADVEWLRSITKLPI